MFSRKKAIKPLIMFKSRKNIIFVKETVLIANYKYVNLKKKKMYKKK